MLRTKEAVDLAGLSRQLAPSNPAPSLGTILSLLFLSNSSLTAPKITTDAVEAPMLLLSLTLLITA
jgi:hypothetical protein